MTTSHNNADLRLAVDKNVNGVDFKGNKGKSVCKASHSTHCTASSFFVKPTDTASSIHHHRARDMLGITLTKIKCTSNGIPYTIFARRNTTVV